MNYKTISEISELILTFILERSGNNFLDNQRNKNIIKKILKKDKRYIKHLFYDTNNESYLLIENFIICIAFTDPSLYSSFEISDEIADLMWKDFSVYWTHETGDQL